MTDERESFRSFRSRPGIRRASLVVLGAFLMVNAVAITLGVTSGALRHGSAVLLTIWALAFAALLLLVRSWRSTGRPRPNSPSRGV
jgi:hypothetical protein